MDLRKSIEDYLKDAEVMQIATVRDGNPWVCTVNYVFDENLNLYWMSLRSTRHSKEVVDNSLVAGAIVRNPKVKQGIQFEGKGREITGEELIRIHKLYGERYGDKPKRLEEAQSGDPSVRTYYGIQPSTYVLFDEENTPYSQELKLK